MNIYIEISGRRSGKTTRLLTKAQERMSCGHSAVIVFPSCRMARYISKTTAAICIGKEELTTEFCNTNTDERTLWFFDEFDLMNGVPIIDNGYYVTTPKFVRKNMLDINDKLIQLLRISGGATRFKSPFYSSELFSRLDDCEKTGSYVEGGE